MQIQPSAVVLSTQRMLWENSNVFAYRRFSLWPVIRSTTVQKQAILVRPTWNDLPARSTAVHTHDVYYVIHIHRIFVYIVVYSYSLFKWQRWISVTVCGVAIGALSYIRQNTLLLWWHAVVNPMILKNCIARTSSIVICVSGSSITTAF